MSEKPRLTRQQLLDSDPFASDANLDLSSYPELTEDLPDANDPWGTPNDGLYEASDTYGAGDKTALKKFLANPDSEASERAAAETGNVEEIEKQANVRIDS